MANTYISKSKDLAGYKIFADKYMREAIVFQVSVEKCIKHLPKFKKKIRNQYVKWEKLYLDVILDGKKFHDAKGKVAREKGEEHLSVVEIYEIYSKFLNYTKLDENGKLLLTSSEEDKKTICFNIYKNLVKKIVE